MINNHVYQFSVATEMPYDKTTTKPQWFKTIHIYFCLYISDQSWAQQG